MRDLNRSPHKLISDDPRGMIRGHGGRNGQREGWMSDCSGGGGNNEDRGRERRMAIGREDHPQPRWGGQAITSWGRRGTGIGV